MPADFTKHLEWLVTMAKTKGWEAYAWHRAKELDLTFPGVAKELVRIMNENKSSVSRRESDAKP